MSWLLSYICNKREVHSIFAQTIALLMVMVIWFTYVLVLGTQDMTEMGRFEGRRFQIPGRANIPAQIVSLMVVWGCSADDLTEAL